MGSGYSGAYMPFHKWDQSFEIAACWVLEAASLPLTLFCMLYENVEGKTDLLR